MKNYLVITPCKNEEKNILALGDSIVKQTILPSLWLIVDDGSDDSTPNKLKQLISNYEWIRVHTIENSKRDLSFHYSEVVTLGFELAMKIAEDKKISFDYIGLIDADMILSMDFFEKIIDRFENNLNLGIASGTAQFQKRNNLFVESGRDNLPIGGLRVWRKDCFLRTGFPRSYSADSVSNVLAILDGWELAKYPDILAIQARQTSSAEGLWKGYITRGISDYYRDYHPFYILFKSINYALNSPFYLWIPYLQGYLHAVIKIRTKIESPKVRNYYRNKHREVIDYYGKKYKN